MDVELDYTTGNNPYNSLVQSGDEIRLGVSKDFMDGRLRINSSLDMPIASDGSSTLLLGDTQIEYELTKDGRTVLRAFNRSNRNDPLLQNTGPYTQGSGFSSEGLRRKVIYFSRDSINATAAAKSSTW